MTEAGKGAEEVQDILLKNVAMFQKVCDRIQFEGVSRSEFAMLHMIHSEKDRRISYVSLSPEGEALYEMCAERMRRIGDRTVEAMGREDMIQMLGLFQRFFEIFGKELDKDTK